MMVNKCKNLVGLFTFLTGAFFFADQPANAGGFSIGGGNAEVCFQNERTLLEVQARNGIVLDKHLDDVESIKIHDLIRFKGEVIPAKENETPVEYSMRIAKRFENSFPSLSHLIKGGVVLLNNGSLDFEDGPLYRVSDENDPGPSKPERCIVVTLARQTRQSTAGQKPRLVVDSRLFNHPRHPIQSRGSFLIHEFIYYSLWKENPIYEVDSYRTQKLVQIAVDRNLRNFNQIDSMIEKLQITKDSTFDNKDAFAPLFQTKLSGCFPPKRVSLRGNGSGNDVFSFWYRCVEQELINSEHWWLHTPRHDGKNPGNGFVEAKTKMRYKELLDDPYPLLLPYLNQEQREVLKGLIEKLVNDQDNFSTFNRESWETFLVEVRKLNLEID